MYLFDTSVWNGRIYLAGGYDFSNYFNLTRSIGILANGSLGSWRNESIMNVRRSGLSSVVWNGRLYAIAGSNSGPVNSIEHADILSNGSLSSWSLESATLASTLNTMKSLAWNNRIYRIGGYSGAPTETIESFQIQGISSSGNYTSRVIDLNETKSVVGVNWTSFNSNGSLQFVYRVGED